MITDSEKRLEAFEKMRTHLFGSATQSSPSPSSVMGYYLEKQNDVSNDKAKAEYSKAVAAKEIEVFRW